MATSKSPLPPMPSTLVGALGRPVWNEARVGLERAHLRRTAVPLGAGNGRRIVLVTGYLAGDASAKPLYRWLDAAGFDVDVAEVGRNMSTSTAATDRIVDALNQSDGPSILIGHSRGGQQCRVAALRRPERVSQLITLAAPVRAHLPRQFVLRASVEALRLLSYLPVGPDNDLGVDDQYEVDLFAPFEVDVPWTSIWSKLDGVVEWQACLDEAASSTEVHCSHSGMLASVSSFRAIAAVLREHEEPA